MKNKRGFTLIELLAVIVILAIIALIAIPIVMNVIENSKKGAAKRSAENYLKSIKTAIVTEKLNGKVMDGTYKVDSEGNLCPNIGECTEERKIVLDISETKITDGTIIIKDEDISNNSVLEINDHVVNIVDGNSSIGEYGTVVDNLIEQTVPIKYDPVADAVCESGDTCYNWYVLDGNESEYAYVSLIMDRNIGENVAWISEDDYKRANIDKTVCDKNACDDEGPVTALTYLLDQTKTWNVDVSLPSGKQLAIASGYTEPIESIERISLSPWLYTNINDGTNNTLPFGYWISEPLSAYISGTTKEGIIGTMYIWINRRGVRPVITISKNNL